MTLLNIYSLDDTELQNVIACLPEGKHVIGRGGLLQVTDKRVSRQHAVIEVSSEKVVLTSVHVNPCFFKASNGKTLLVLTQNKESELNDGDQFALLPETCWFKVKIKSETLLNDSLANNSTAEVNGKRHHNNNLDDSDSKRARLSTTANATSIHNADNSASTSNITVEVANNVQMETSQESEELGDIFEEGNALESNASLNLAETERIKDDSEDVTRKIKEEPQEHDANVSASTSNSTLNILNNSSTPNPEIKEEPLNHDNIDRDASKNIIPVQNNENTTDQQPEEKTEIEHNNQNKDGASGSGTGPEKVHRERCWYGAQCFRKNPNHRQSFAHPGDQDYESDPDDDRPECPYGTTCYRKNPEHRRDYKHTGKPAPKPIRFPTPPGSPPAPNQPPNQKKPRKAATKKAKPKDDIDSSQDDYDFDDPFLNDGSSDDFLPSDEIDSGSDWEDSQEVEESQERKRMLKEAKKFTKKGK